MVAIRKDEAVDRLTQAVKEACADDLVEIYHEIFPTLTAAQEKAKEDSSALVKEIIEHIASGLEVEEILDLWNVVFPTHRNVWFDEGEGMMHYDEKIEHVGLVD